MPHSIRQILNITFFSIGGILLSENLVPEIEQFANHIPIPEVIIGSILFIFGLIYILTLHPSAIGLFYPCTHMFAGFLIINKAHELIAIDPITFSSMLVWGTVLEAIMLIFSANNLFGEN